MHRDDAAIPLAAILLIGVTVTAGASFAVYVMSQEPETQPLAVGFRVDNDPDRLEVEMTAGDELDAATTRLVVETEAGTGSVDAAQVPNLGATWRTGEAACIAGQGPNCLQVTGADEITGVRVASGDQLLHQWTGTPETTRLSAGTGPKLAIGGSSGTGSPGSSGSPNLVVTSLTPNDTSPLEDEPVTFDVTVENTGNAEASATTLDVQVDNATIDTVSVAELAGGDSTTVTTGTWTASAGLHDVDAIADAPAQVDESDETDNTDDVSLAVATASPGHAYEDVDNDAYFTAGTDRKIPDSEVTDGEYHVEDPWSLVIPSGVGAITAPRVNFTAGSNGHVIVDVDLTTTDELVNLAAGSYVEATDVAFTSPDERIQLASEHKAVYVNGSTLDSSNERVILRGEDVHAENATLTSDDERAILDADESVHLAGATVDVDEKIPITSGHDVDLTDASLTASEEITIDTAASATVTVDGATISDEDDTAIVSPSGATISGSAASGSVEHGGGGGPGGPP